MITADELLPISLFATLGADARERLARTCPDIRLGAGEFVVHEGDERALYVILDGRIEVVKAYDGVVRTLGWREAGAYFGEVPLALGSPFPGAYRAAEASRVMRLDAQQYYALAAAHPEVAAQVGKLAGERIGGLQGLAAEPPKPRLKMLARAHDARSADYRRFLTLNQVTFEALSPDDADFATRWKGPEPEACPAFQLVGGATLVRPDVRVLAEHLGLETTPSRAEYDAVVIGGGPAGLAAAVYGASEGLSTLVIEREAPGGQAGTSSRIENYLGFPSGVSGDELAGRALQQARRLGAEILVTRAIERIDPVSRTVYLDGGQSVRARTIIFATGVAWRRLNVEGFDRLFGRGVFYGAARSEAASTHGSDIHLIGAGNSAGQAALFFANHARTVTLVVRGDSVEKSMSRYLVDQLRQKSNIKVELNSEITAAHGEERLTAVDVFDRNGKTTSRRESGGVFVFIGADAETGWLPDEVARDGRGYVLTGEDAARSGKWPAERDPYLLETSVPGIFACGDVRFSPVKRVAAAVGEGSMAIAFVHQYLAREAAAAGS
jgi:thioredoxin reductase (NADPH)